MSSLCTTAPNPRACGQNPKEVPWLLGAQGRNRTADTGIFKPWGIAKNEVVGAVFGGDCRTRAAEGEDPGGVAAAAGGGGGQDAGERFETCGSSGAAAHPRGQPSEARCPIREAGGGSDLACAPAQARGRTLKRGTAIIVTVHERDNGYTGGWGALLDRFGDVRVLFGAPCPRKMSSTPTFASASLGGLRPRSPTIPSRHRRLRRRCRAPELRQKPKRRARRRSRPNRPAPICRVQPPKRQRSQQARLPRPAGVLAGHLPRRARRSSERLRGDAAFAHS